MSRAFRILSVLMILSLALSACAPKAAPTPTTAPTTPAAPAKPPEPTKPPVPTALPKPVTLQVWTWDYAAFPSWFEGLKARFEKDHPWVTVEYSKEFGTDWNAKALAALAAGEPPDLMMYAESTPAFWTMPIKEGKYQLLDDLMSKYKWPDFYASTDLWTKYEGKRYGIPINFQGIAIGYNKAVFEKLGLQAPKTEQELLAVAKTLQQNGYMPLVTNWGESWSMLDIVGGIYHQLDPGLVDFKKVESGEQKAWESKLLQEAVAITKRWMDEGIVDKQSIGLTQMDTWQLFEQGKAGMQMPGGMWVMADWAKGMGPTFSFFPYPAVKEGATPQGTAGAAHSYCMPSEGKNKELALEFLNSMVGEAADRDLVATGNIPCHPLSFEVKAEDVAAIPYDVFQFWVANIGEWGPRNFTLHSEVNTPLWDAALQVMGGQVSVADFPAKFEELAEKGQ